VASGRLERLSSALLVSALLACTSAGTVDPGGPDLLAISIGNAQTATVSTAVATDPVVVVTDTRGRPRSNVVVRFSGDTEGDWVTVDSMRTDANGRATTRWYLGPRVGAYTLTAQVGNATVTATATATALQPGTRHLGRNQYVEFIVGDLPIVLSAPHGGLLTPAEIPNRTTGETVRDSNTDTLAIEIGNAFNQTRGHRPHVIVVRLHRSKLDANREIVEAAQGNAFAQIAWREFQGFIEAAREDVRIRFINGFYIDLHGHGHTIPRLELGYLLTGTELASTDAALNALVAQTSVRGLAQRRSIALTALLRGPQSLGAMFEQEGFAAVPSPVNPDPAGAVYFSGGYNTDRHSSRAGGTIDGVQIESHFAGVRDTEANRQRFAAALVSVLDRYFTLYYSPLPR
jgi:hypothetical protein